MHVEARMSREPIFPVGVLCVPYLSTMTRCTSSFSGTASSIVS